jgi:hypothetical protein
MDTAMRPLAKQVARDVLRGLVFDSLVEASMIKILGKEFLPHILSQLARECVSESLIKL